MVSRSILAARRRCSLPRCASPPRWRSAQSPAVNPKEADDAQPQQQRQATQPLNNQPVWKEIRSGAPQVTTVKGRETNVLIQPEGQTWRALRVPISRSGRHPVRARACSGSRCSTSLRGTMAVERAGRASA